MYRVRAHTMKGDIPLGYYCPGCQSIQNTKREYLVPIDLITRLDPFFKTVSKRETYLAILKTGDRAIPHMIATKMIDNPQDAIGSALVPFCRALGTREAPRLDHNKICQDLEKSFEIQVLASEHKEAAANQEFIK